MSSSLVSLIFSVPTVIQVLVYLFALVLFGMKWKQSKRPCTFGLIGVGLMFGATMLGFSARMLMSWTAWSSEHIVGIHAAIAVVTGLIGSVGLVLLVVAVVADRATDSLS